MNMCIYYLLLLICTISYVSCKQETFCRFPNLEQFKTPHNRPQINLQEYNEDCIVKRNFVAHIEGDVLYIENCNQNPSYKLPGQTQFTPYTEPVHTKTAAYAHVSCDNQDPMLVISPASISDKVTNTKASPQNKNVFVIMLDALSHEALHRYMHKTVNFLEKQEGFSAYEFKQYSTVGLNSNPNKFQLFGRHDYDEIIKKGVTSNLTWIWDYAKKLGYMNLVGEDGCPHNRFIWDLMGVTTKDTSIDFTLLEQFCAETPNIKNHHCYSGKWAFEYQIDYFNAAFRDLEKSKSTQPVFMYANFIECHEPIQWGASLMDEPIVKFLQTIISSPLMENGVLVFLSDHGLHFGDYGYSSVLGMTENRHPFLYMITPKGVADNSYITENVDRLVTPSDVYKTLVGLINSKEAPIDVHDYDLFAEEVSADRNCEMAGIPILYCICSYGPTCDRGGIPDIMWRKCASQFQHPFFFDWEHYSKNVLTPAFGGSFDECDAVRHWCAYGVALGWNGTESLTIRDYVAHNPGLFQNEIFCWNWPSECNWINVVEHYFTAGFLEANIPSTVKRTEKHVQKRHHHSHDNINL